MNKQKNEKSVNYSVDRGTKPKNESASASPDRKPETSELDSYSPPPRKKKD